MIQKIVVLGPESTGKSTLCKILADHYGTVWVPEFAREYLLEHGINYSYEDLLTIAKGQLALEDDMAKRAMNNLLFVDTNMYVMKVWCEFVFGACHQWILDRIAERKYSYYLLCSTDLLWVKDELREYPDPASRNALYHIYKDHMVNQELPWKAISGSYDERFKLASSAVNELLRNLNSQ